MVQLEKILGFIVLIACVLKVMLLSGAGLLLTISILPLCTLYHFLGFAMFNKIPLKHSFYRNTYKSISLSRILIGFVSGLVLSIQGIGILFSLNHWPGAKQNLFLGFLGVGILALFLVIKYLKTKSAFYSNILKRVFLLAALGLVAVIMYPYL